MRSHVEIENIEELRRQEGIDDVELRKEVRDLRAGDFVKLTLLTSATAGGGETLSVRITSIRGSAFRGKLATKPTSPAFAQLQAGSPITFTPAHIHSIAKRARTRAK